MKYNIKELVEMIINNVNSNWTINEKLRYVYITVGKYLAKDVTFFYSLGSKIGEESLEFDEIRERYVEDKVIDNKVICKSAALILKEIYDAIGIDCKLMQSTDYQIIGDEFDRFELYHWFLCCTGDDGKKYFLTLVPDLMNIQNNWQTEHFATYISYFRRSINNEADETPSYLGERIYEDIMDKKELEQLDMRVGYLKKSADEYGVVTPTPKTGLLDIKDYIYYENGEKESGITLNQSPFIYENAVDYIGSKKGYANILAEETDFYQNAFLFINEDGVEINFLETPLRMIESRDINHWASLLQMKIIDMSNIVDKEKERMIYQVESVREKLVSVKMLINHITRKKEELKQANNPNQIKLLKEEIETLEKDALNNVKKARTVLYLIARNFIDSKYTNNTQGNNYSSEYIIKRFETVIPMILVLNDEYNKPMTARCNGLGEQLALVDRILRDLFDGNVVAAEKEKNRIVRTALYNPVTTDYDLIFQIDKEHYYFLNPNTGEFRALPNPIELVTEKGYIVLNDEVNDRILEIEKEIEGKAK